MKFRLSPSSVATFKECKLKFKLSQIDRLQPLTRGSIYTALGSAFHNAIKTYIDLKGTDIATLTAIFIKELDAELTKLGSAEIPARDELIKNGTAMLVNYMARDNSDKLLSRIVEHEKKHELEYDGYTVVGIIDVVYGSDGAVDIEDYKTSKRAKTQEEADEDYQLGTYALIYYKTKGIVPKSLNLYYVRHNQVVTTTRTLEQILEIEKYNNALYNDMSKETEWAANHTACFNCDYIHNCPSRTKIRLH